MTQAYRTAQGRLRYALASSTQTLPVVLILFVSCVTAQAQRWSPQYKIKPHEVERLTAADVVGPDGVVYPDWRYAGIAGGIPNVRTVVRASQFGAKPDDGVDDSPAITRAITEAAKKGGGAVELESGVYHLDRPIWIPYDGIVLRGQGPKKTHLVFRYNVPQEQVVFFAPSPGEHIGPDWPIEIHAFPDGLELLELQADGKTVTSAKRHKHWGGTFALRTFGTEVLKLVGKGKHKLTAFARWSNGKTDTAEISVVLDPNLPWQGGRRLPSRAFAAILFHGEGRNSPAIRIVKDARRGDRHLLVETARGLRAGDAVQLEAPATERWNRLVENACRWGSYRKGQFRIEKIEDNRLIINQPLRLDFPTVDGSFLRRIDPIRRCGVENLSIEQTHKLWFCGVLFYRAWNCWVRNVHVYKAGRHPAYAIESKWCEIRDCLFDDAWYHGGGGTAYVGWENSFDCLMENVTTYRMRHAPCVQWAASGNVIRASVFHGSDAQWHAGWTNENLFEQCVIDAAGNTGSYGHGGWASPPYDEAHGPQGPRNVVYNCDIHGVRTGLWFGGMNEGWLILYNRIVADTGPGIFIQRHSFDHIIRGNVIAVAGNRPGVHIATADCTGIELLENRFYTRQENWLSTKAKLAVESNNRWYSYRQTPPRPQPAVPSIFLWQRQFPLPQPIRARSKQ